MKRWIAKVNDIVLDNLYYETAEEIRVTFPEATDIVENKDQSWKEYVEQIRNSSVGSLLDYKGREILKIPDGKSFILVRLHRIDDEYINSLYYQRQQNGLTAPIMWDISTPKEFVGLFLSSDFSECLEPGYISLNELKKLKAKCFHNRDGYRFYVDNSGYYYVVKKSDIPGKKQKDEYERFRGNDSAVFVSWNICSGHSMHQWFDSLEQFEAYAREHGIGHYFVKRTGYKKLPPMDRRIVFRTPPFNVLKEVALAKRKTSNENGVLRHVVLRWRREADAATHGSCFPIEIIEALVRAIIATTVSAPVGEDRH